LVIANTGADVLKEVFHRYLGVEMNSKGANTIIKEVIDKGAIQARPRSGGGSMRTNLSSGAGIQK
jgi:hypothetical protein